MAVHKVSMQFDGKEVSLETGKLAKFANGSVTVRCGDTMLLVVATAAQTEKVDIDFLPLQVEYREKMASAGKIPGGFFRREGKPTDKEVLASRLIDRPLRPLFPKYWQYETQVIAQVFSAEPDVDPENLACFGASAALLISDIPFNGPISEVRVGKIDGKYLANPSAEQLKECTLDITIAGSDKSIMMVEGESNEISEEEFVDALLFGHERIRELNALQMQLHALVNTPKREVNDKSIPEEIVAKIDESIAAELKEYVYSVTTKAERGAKRTELRDKAVEVAKIAFSEHEVYAEKLEKLANQAFSKLEKKAMRAMILDSNKRLDGRTTTDIRPISCEVKYLPRTHGSALFTRGETQSLTTVTLGTSKDEQIIDGLLPNHTNRFLLHYNFPPYSVGEVGRFGMVGRREVGHGNLAERALKKVMPSQEDFGYTVRIVSDILESNGSSSMATVCAGSLALFDAGVPLKKSIAGIAMGLISEDDRVAILSDILGDEDFLGDMDFKVAGSKDGITACQMDIKIEGLSMEILTKALHQAKAGRLHILGIMDELLPAPKTEMSEFAPRFEYIKIPIDTIGAVIGTGGETIRGIVRETGAEINIADDGTVTVAATSQASSDAAKLMIEQLTRKPVAGEIYTCKIKELREGLGALVEFMPKQTGLVHISALANERVETLEGMFQPGETFEAMLIEITRDGKYRLSRKAVLNSVSFEEIQEAEKSRPKPPPRSGDRFSRDGGGGRDRDRRSGGGDRDRRDNRGNERSEGGDRPERQERSEPRDYNVD